MNKRVEEPGSLLAKPWDVVVCKNNHPCLIALKEIRIGDPISERAFLAIGETVQPRERTLVRDTKCPDCQEPVFVGEGGMVTVRGIEQGKPG
jgi:hypothetical protein